MIEAMRERIRIQKSRADTDGNGNHILVWEDCYSCRAYANNLSGKEYWEAAGVNAEKDMYFMIRYCSEVAGLDSEHYRIVFRDRIYNITFVDNIRYANRTVKIRASQEKR